MHIVYRPEKDGHECTLYIYGIYTDISQARCRMRKVSDELASKYQSENFPASVEYKEDRSIIRCGAGDRMYVRIRHIEQDVDTNLPITVYT